MSVALELARQNFYGLCFINLVDFDMLYGHRQDVTGYARAFGKFDAWLPVFLSELRDDDAVIITADHGCDPADNSTDHTREFVPLLVYGKGIKPVPLGTRKSFADIAASICQWLGVNWNGIGESFAQI